MVTSQRVSCFPFSMNEVTFENTIGLSVLNVFTGENENPNMMHTTSELSRLYIYVLRIVQVLIVILKLKLQTLSLYSHAAQDN